MNYCPEVVQVKPNPDYTVIVYFSDGKVVKYDVEPLLTKEVFSPLKDKHIFMYACTIMNDTLAWDISGERDETNCIDIAPETLYALPAIDDIF